MTTGPGFPWYPVPPPRRAQTQAAKAREPFGWGFFCLSVLPSSVAETASRAGRSSASKASWSGRRAPPSRSWTLCEAGDAGHEHHRAEHPGGPLALNRKRGKAPSRREALPRLLPQAGGEERERPSCRRSDFARCGLPLSPPLLAGEAGRGPVAAPVAAWQRSVAPKDPPPTPPASGRGESERPPPNGSKMVEQSLQFLPSPACGRGRVGGQRPRSPARPAAPEGPPPTPPASGRGESERPPPNGSKMVEQSLQFLPSPACGGGRVGDSGHAARQGPPRRKALPRPLPQAGGKKASGLRRTGARWWNNRCNSSPLPLAGEAGWGTAATQPGKARRAERPSPDPSRKREGRKRAASAEREQDGGTIAAIAPLSRLRGRPGGGQRPRNTARHAAPEGPPPTPPASGRGESERPSPNGSKMVEQSLQFLPSPACGGGRVGDSGRATRQGTPRRKTPPPTPPASGRGDKGAALRPAKRL